MIKQIQVEKAPVFFFFFFLNLYIFPLFVVVASVSVSISVSLFLSSGVLILLCAPGETPADPRFYGQRYCTVCSGADSRSRGNLTSNPPILLCRPFSLPVSTTRDTSRVKCSAPAKVEREQTEISHKRNKERIKKKRKRDKSLFSCLRRINCHQLERKKKKETKKKRKREREREREREKYRLIEQTQVSESETEHQGEK